MDPQIIVALIGMFGLVISTHISYGRKLGRIETNSQVTRAQTENDHGDADYPNLRDELTATRGLIHGLGRQLGGLEQWVKDLATGSERIDNTITRKALAAARDLAVSVEERDQRIAELLRKDIPEIVARQINRHVTDCPLRNPQNGERS